MDKEEQVRIEKFAVLIALESEKKGFKKIGQLTSRSDLLASPITGFNLDWKNTKKSLQGLWDDKQKKISQKGRETLYDPNNQPVVLKILSSAMKDIGNQFIGYGKFMEELSNPSYHNVPDMSLNDFKKVLRNSYDYVMSQETELDGVVAPIDLVKKHLISQNSGLTSERINDLLLELEKTHDIELQVAYDSSRVNNPEDGINVSGRGLIYYIKIW